MSRYIVKRILMMIPTLFGAAFLVFFLLRLIPGDVCELRLAGTGLYVDQETIDICRYKLGLHQPMMVQFFDFLVGIVTFDLGESMWTGKPIVYEMGLRFELSLQIAIMATITSIFIAIPLGTISAIRQDTWIDYIVRTISIAGIAIPSFWYGILIIFGLLITFWTVLDPNMVQQYLNKFKPRRKKICIYTRVDPCIKCTKRVGLGRSGCGLRGLERPCVS